jgi:hypothetical protein
MIYELHFIGGPNDGQIAHAFKPMDCYMTHENHVYAAEFAGEPCLEWQADNHYKITMYYQPNCKNLEHTTRKTMNN